MSPIIGNNSNSHSADNDLMEGRERAYSDSNGRRGSGDLLLGFSWLVLEDSFFLISFPPHHSWNFFWTIIIFLPSSLDDTSCLSLYLLFISLLFLSFFYFRPFFLYIYISIQDSRSALCSKKKKTFVTFPAFFFFLFRFRFPPNPLPTFHTILPIDF